MPFATLPEYLRKLESEGELVRVSEPVNAELEVTEIATRALAENRPAILFTNVVNSTMPLAINILASERRIELALGRHPSQIGEEILAAAEELLPPTASAVWRHRTTLLRAAKLRPKHSRRPAVKKNRIEPPELTRLPILKCWPFDGGRFITLPLVVTQDPVSKKPNLGMYRMQEFSPTTTGMHMQIQKGGGFHHYLAEQLNQSLPVVVAVGADPALIISSITPLPEGIDELGFAGFLRGKRTRVFKAHNGLLAPAEAEILLLGEVPPHIRQMEGPFGDHFGHYSEAAPFPVFNISTIYHRTNPVYAATVVGIPPKEDKFIGDASQLAVGQIIRLLRKDVRQIWAYFEAGFHNLLVVSLEQRYEREAIKTALGLLGEGQLSLSKVVVCVGPDVDPTSPTAVLRAIKDNFIAQTSFRLISRTAQDTLDFTSEVIHQGSKIIIDATPKNVTAPYTPSTIKNLHTADVPSGVQEHRILDGTMLVMKTAGDGAAIVKEVIANPNLNWLKLAVAVSEDINIWDRVQLLWGIFTRFDCSQDIAFSDASFKGIEPIYSGVMGIDATWKKGYPEPLAMEESVVKKVDSKWSRYWHQTK